MNAKRVKSMGDGWFQEVWRDHAGRRCSRFVPPENWDGSDPSWAIPIKFSKPTDEDMEQVKRELDAFRDC